MGIQFSLLFSVKVDLKGPHGYLSTYQYPLLKVTLYICSICILLCTVGFLLSFMVSTLSVLLQFVSVMPNLTAVSAVYEHLIFNALLNVYFVELCCP